MHVIIPASDMDIAICPLSEPICKTLVPINNKPVLQYILDELYSYMEYIDEIVIAKRNSDDVLNYVCHTSNIDPLFRERIHVVETKQSNLSGAEYAFMDDFYAGMEHLVDVVHAPMSEILLWRGDVLTINTSKLTDMSLPSYVCVDSDNNPIGICKFTNFVLSVNINVRMNNQKQDGHYFTLSDFIKEYKESGEEVELLSDYGDYLNWQDRTEYYKIQSSFIEKDEHSKFNIEINYDKQQITKTNKYADDEYNRQTFDTSRRIQALLFSESSALEIANSEQKIFLPELIETGISQRGNFIDTLTEEYVSGTTLSSLMTDQKLSKSTWKKILERIDSNILNDVFFKCTLSYRDIRNELVDLNIEDEYVNDINEWIKDSVLQVSNKFTEENIETYYYVMENQKKIDWSIFADKLCEDVKNHIDAYNIFYQGSLERMTHGNPSFDNIIYDQFTGAIHLINPCVRQYQLTWTVLDIAYLYYSIISGVHQIKKGLYEDTNGVVSITKDAYETMITCEEIMDSLYSNENADFMKRLSLIILLSKIARDEFSPEISSVLMRYANETLKNIYWERIIN